MQPASHKPKLPKHLSFPIGFEAISKGLVSVSFADDIHLEFTDGSPFWRTYINSKIDADEPYAVARASYEKWDKRLGVAYAGSLNAGVWNIVIYPVRRELKSVAKTALVHVGLPAMAEWFCAKRPESWYWGKKLLHVSFTPKLGTVEIQEEIVRT